MRKLRERWRENELPGSHPKGPPKGAKQWAEMGGGQLGAPRGEAERRQAPAERGEVRGSPRVTASLNSPRSGQGQWPWTRVKTLGALLSSSQVGRGRNFSPAVHRAFQVRVGAPVCTAFRLRPTVATGCFCSQSTNSFLPEGVASSGWVPATSKTGVPGHRSPCAR